MGLCEYVKLLGIIWDRQKVLNSQPFMTGVLPRRHRQGCSCKMLAWCMLSCKS